MGDFFVLKLVSPCGNDIRIPVGAQNPKKTLTDDVERFFVYLFQPRLARTDYRLCAVCDLELTQDIRNIVINCLGTK